MSRKSRPDFLMRTCSNSLIWSCVLRRALVACKQNVVTDTLTNNEPTDVLVWAMKPIFHACQRFPADVIRHAAWLYLRFTWNVRDIEDLLSDRKQKVSNELIRRWILNFWPLISKKTCVKPGLEHDLQKSCRPFGYDHAAKQRDGDHARLSRSNHGLGRALLQ